MSDDVFLVMVAAASVLLFLLVGLGLSAIVFDKDGYWRWRK